MNIDLFSYSNMGSRDHNEDNFGVDNREDRFTAVVCDGLGGHNCGEVASKVAVSSIIKDISALKAVTPEDIFAIVQKTNDGLVTLQKTNPDYKGMRTTAVGCVVEKDTLRYFNSGDSRFYLFSGGVLKAMSKDHSVSQMTVDLGEMPFESIRFDTDRNKLLKVLGETAGTEVCTVYKNVDYKPGDAFLLCSDGFWEYVLEDEMEIDLSKSKTAKEWIEFMLVRLMLKCNNDNDNYTVVGGILL